jgi:AraC-like DNA-binding protein
MQSRTNDQKAASLVAPSRSAGRTGTDPLSQVLTWVRLRGEAVMADHIAQFEQRTVSTGAGRFYFISSGALELAVPGSLPVFLRGGDLVLLPRGTAHCLNVPNTGAGRGQDDPMEAHFVAGVYRFDGGALPPVMAALPDLIVVSATKGLVPDWLSAITHFLLEESAGGEPGSHLMVSRLVDLLVIRALRTWATVGDGRFGRFAGLSDERIGHALSALHGAPYHRWTVAELASASAMSRSGFAERFTATVGESPLRYLARWRLHLAAEMLNGGGLRISEVAQRVGYSSDAAFSRAFKACFGHRPGERRTP